MLLKDNLLALLSFPALKLPYKNEWAEEDGSEYDLTNPVCEKQEVIFKFYVPENRYDDFMNMFRENTYNVFHIESIRKTFNLRFVSVSNMKFFNEAVFFDLKLSNDNPFTGYTYQEPTLITNDSNALLDGKNLSEYGIRLSQGSKEEIISKGEIKDPLLIQNSLFSGAKVGNTSLFYKERTARLKCNIHQSLDDFFKGYQAFFYDLTKPNEHILTFENTNYKCLYKESKITGMLIKEESIWVDFDLALIITSAPFEADTKIFDTTFDFTFE